MNFYVQNEGVMLSNLKKKTTLIVEFCTVLTFLIPLPYTAGWSFAYHYFAKFNIELQDLAIEQNYYFLYCFWVIIGQLLPILLLLLPVLTSFIFLISYLHKKSEEIKIDDDKQKHSPPIPLHLKKNILQVIHVAIIPIFIFVMFGIFYYLGIWAANSKYEQQVVDDFPSYPRIKIFLTLERAKQIGKIANEWSKGCYRLLTRNKDNFFIFYSINKSTVKIPTDVIPVKYIQYIRILPLYHSCNE